MIILKQYRISRKDIRANPGALYIFGDNLERKGYGGQAAEMRGEINSFGFATKRSISHNYPNDYFFDTQSDVMKIIYAEFTRLHTFIAFMKPHTIVLPLDGIGTGLSKLPEYAPNALAYIDKHLENLRDIP